MHYSVLVLTEKLPTKEELDKILSPYNDEELDKIDSLLTQQERIEKFPFNWDYYQIGGRYGGNIKYKIKDDDYKFYNHNLNHIKFISALFDKLRDNYKDRMSFFEGKLEECDFIQYLGIHDNIIYCDGTYIKNIENIEKLKDFGCYIIDKNKNVFFREAWNGSEFIKNKNYSNELSKILEEQSDCFLTIIDIHD